MKILGGPQNPLFEALREAATQHTDCALRMAVAWVNEEGAALLRDAISPDVEKLDAIIGINNQGTTAEGMLELLSISNSLRVLYQHPFVTFHPKAYCFDNGEEGTLLMGSSNLTGGGLDTNFEASIAVDLQPPLREQWTTYWSSLEEHDFCFEIDSPTAVERLYEAGYLLSEAAARSKRQSRRGPRHDAGESEPLPTKPGIRRFRPLRRAVKAPFEVIGEDDGGPLSAATGGTPALFVRTLTPNDIGKLYGKRGTFEPDLGLKARDEHPDFWGWPSLFAEVVRKLPRQERTIEARVFSNETGAIGVPRELVLWFREARPNHAAEFRFRLGGLKDKAIVPDGFDEDSVVVFEKSGAGFNILLVTPEDLPYPEYAKLLKTVRSAHRYGYGP